LTFEQLGVAFRQGLIDSRTLVANDAVPRWTSLERLARGPEPRAKPEREPITEKRLRVFAPAVESPVRAVERGPLPPSTSPSVLPAGSISPPGEAAGRARGLSALQGWRAGALAALLALATLRVGYSVIQPRLADEAAAPRSLLQLSPAAPASALPERRPSPPVREIPAASAALEQLPIVRVSALPLAPARYQRQHLRRRRSQTVAGGDERRDQLGGESWHEAERTIQPRSAR